MLVFDGLIIIAIFVLFLILVLRKKEINSVLQTAFYVVVILATVFELRQVHQENVDKLTDKSGGKSGDKGDKGDSIDTTLVTSPLVSSTNQGPEEDHLYTILNSLSQDGTGVTGDDLVSDVHYAGSPDDNIKNYKELTSSDTLEKSDYDAECDYDFADMKINPKSDYDNFRGNFTVNDDDKYSTDLDYMMARQSESSGKKAQRSIVIRNNMTAGSMAKYYKEELEGYNNRDWWERDDETAGLDNYNHPTYSDF